MQPSTIKGVSLTREKNNSSKTVTECIVLAGGLGTRLRSAVPDLPKCMAVVAGKPFLYHVINFLRLEGIDHFIFSLGYKHEVITGYLQNDFSTLSYSVVIEDEPLGTGGAIQLACSKATSQNVLVVNGDTLFKGNLKAFAAFHTDKKAECSLLLKPMKNFDRYGVVETNSDDCIVSFKEKQAYDTGNINAGVYLLNVKAFGAKQFPEKFSFEKDYLEKYISTGKLYGLAQGAYFIDIGIPEDYKRADNEMEKPIFDFKKINKNWTIFLDRDGVINKDKKGSYIFNADEFVFLDGMPALFKTLKNIFKRAIVVTNQRGVGKGLMTDEDLQSIHAKMVNAIENVGGEIDGIYYAPAIVNDDPYRKPNPGMACVAISDFTDIDLGRCIMVGNKMSDMQFGKNAGMYTVFVATTNPETPFPHPDIDLRYDNLNEFVIALQNNCQDLL